jgi:hypothetical protein
MENYGTSVIFAYVEQPVIDCLIIVAIVASVPETVVGC